MLNTADRTVRMRLRVLVYLFAGNLIWLYIFQHLMVFLYEPGQPADVPQQAHSVMFVYIHYFYWLLAPVIYLMERFGDFRDSWTFSFTLAIFMINALVWAYLMNALLWLVLRKRFSSWRHLSPGTCD